MTIQLPEDFTLSAGSLERVQGFGIFGKQDDLNFGTDESERTIKIVDQCDRYTAANFNTRLTITKI